MEFGKRLDATYTTDFCPRQHVTDLLRGNWCNGFWPLLGRILTIWQWNVRTFLHFRYGDTTLI